MRTLQNDSRGTAIWIEREARGMDPMQMFREFIQNGIEAGATKIIVDGWRDPDTGHLLARVTDNGSGLTHGQLKDRLTSLHAGRSDENYGVGARIASLPTNHAGVTFASRTPHNEGMVTLHKQRGEYGVKEWEVEDDDGDIVLVEVVEPDDGMLERLSNEETGTAVILHGDGCSDTWVLKPQTGYQVHTFLSRRYYDFGPGVNVYVEDIAADASRLRPVMSTGEYLAEYGKADGDVQFENVAGLDGTIFWWIIPDGVEARTLTRGRDALPGGVGLAVESEVFDYAKTYLGDFGIIYPKVQQKLAILIEVDGAEMGTARADVTLPGQNRKSIPWKKFGAFFAENMPVEIDELLSGVTVTTASFDAEMAKLIDPEWMKKLAPMKVTVSSSEGDPGAGDDSGDTVPKGEELEIEHEKHKRIPRRKKRRAAERKNHGDEPSKPKLQTVTPSVEFTDDFDYPNHPFGITWAGAINTVSISETFPPFIREIDRWCEKAPDTARPIIEAAVRFGYQIEFAATIIDANVQSKYNLSPDQVDKLKSDEALYAKALGMQSLTERIGDYIKSMIRNA